VNFSEIVLIPPKCVSAIGTSKRCCGSICGSICGNVQVFVEYIDIHDSQQCFVLNNALTSLSSACGKQEGNVNLTKTFQRQTRIGTLMGSQ